MAQRNCIDVYKSILRYYEQYGDSPSYRELADAMGYSSPNGIVGHATELRIRGLLVNGPKLIPTLLSVSIKLAASQHLTEFTRGLENATAPPRPPDDINGC